MKAPAPREKLHEFIFRYEDMPGNHHMSAARAALMDKGLDWLTDDQVRDVAEYAATWDRRERSYARRMQSGG